MLADDHTLRHLLRVGALTIWPSHTAEEDQALIQPASIDMRLDREFWLMKPFDPDREVRMDSALEVIDPAMSSNLFWERAQVNSGGLMLAPGQFILGSTVEEVTLSAQLAARIEGKSSLGRLGLTVHSTAGWIDPGFSGQITLEIANAANRPIVLRPGMAIAQLAVFQLSRPASVPYGALDRGSHYQGQRGPVLSRSHERFRVWPLPPVTRGAAR